MKTIEDEIKEIEEICQHAAFPMNVNFRSNADPIKTIRNIVPGLTKREYFATMAMHALLTDKSVTADGGGKSGIDELISIEAVKSADALIAELNKESTKAEK